MFHVKDDLYFDREKSGVVAIYKKNTGGGFGFSARLMPNEWASIVSCMGTPGNEEFVPVMGIRLRKDGEHTVVDAEVGGTLVEVIRERSDGEFCHIVEPAGMYSRYYAMPQASIKPARDTET